MARCSLCERTLLAGERPRSFRGERSREHTVCAVCEGAAVALRWLRVEHAPAFVGVNDRSRTVRRVA